MLKKLFFLILFVSIAGLTVLAVLFYAVKRDVSEHLARARMNHLSAIYSDYRLINEQHSLSKEMLLNILKRRNYKKRTFKDLNPGDYRVTDNSITVMTRMFRHPRKTIREPELVTIDFESGNIQNQMRPKSRELVLEPLLLQPLGNASQRASDVIPLQSMPPTLAELVITIEDERFFEHMGVDLIGITRAMITNLRAGRIVQGGSTITQQLAKNLLLTPERTLERKIREAIAALALEDLYSKNKILEMYLNEVYLGQEGNVAIHGMAEAAKVFYGKPLKDISISEAALLAGLIKAPSYYSPQRHLERALDRRNIVLKKALDLKVISSEQYATALKSKPTIIDSTYYKRKAPYFVGAVTASIKEEIDLKAAARAGARIYTGLNMSLQECAEQAVKKIMPEIRKKARSYKGKQLEVGLVSIEPYSGLVRAWVGGNDFVQNQYDHASQAKRQMGSTIKPFLYLTALDKSLNDYKVATPITILPDRPIKIEIRGSRDWIPENYDRKYRGDVTLRYALEKSLNVPAAYITTRFGVPALVNTLKKFKIASSIPSVPSLALGAVEASLYDVTAAYSALANGGIYAPPRLFISVVDGEDNIMSQSPTDDYVISDPGAVYVLTNIMMGVIDRGTARVIRRRGFKGAAAGKTGTSNDGRDSWFVGFTPELTSGAWVGYDDNSPTGLTGGSGAGLLWAEYMNCASPHLRNLNFVRPENVRMVQIDVNTRFQACADTPKSQTVTEAFVKGTEPAMRCYEPREYIDQDQDLDPPETPQPRPRRRRRSEDFWDSLFN